MKNRLFGNVPNVSEGQHFNTRLELSYSRVHRPPRAGVSGSQTEGADSIILSGGYEDDKDFGDVILYAGHGGRNQKSKKQAAHQDLNPQNLALIKNYELKLPIRVVRGAALRSPFTPDTGYRYDGLFYVEAYWKERGKSGFNVYVFKLVKRFNKSFVEKNSS